MSMLDRLRMRRASFTPNSPTSTSMSNSSSTSSSSSHGTSNLPPPSGRIPIAYENPDKNGINWLFSLPDELLERVFVDLDRITLTRCFRVCKRLNELLTTSIPISLSYTLKCNSLILNPFSILPNSANPNHIPASKAMLLNTIRERLTRFKNFKYKSKNQITFKESEGRLYEYLEGVLLRNIPPNPLMGSREIGKEVAVYELSKSNDWEDVKEDDKDKKLLNIKGVIQGQEERISLDRERQNVKRLKLDDNDNDESSTSLIKEQKQEEKEDDVDEHYDEDQLVNDIRKTHQFDFDMQDFAVDPGQDLFVVAEVRHPSPRHYTCHIHLLTLSTFQPHPKAAQHILDWPVQLHTRISSLGFQICDDGLYVLRNNSSGAKDHLVGWQWTTGRLAVTLKPPTVSTFESFILLTPTSFLIPSVRTRLRPDSLIQDDLADARDLIFTHHLHIYAFPPFSSTAAPVKEGEPEPPAHTPTHIAVIDLPEFHIDLDEDLPPPRMTVRTDPPPRHQFPQYPLENIQQFIPDPESGIIILEFYCQPFNLNFGNNIKPHYVMFSLKKTFLAYLPAPTSPLLLQAFPRPAPVIKWETIAPKVRFIGPDEPEPSWVCYVYGSRYVVPYDHEADQSTTIRLYDFDPLRVRQELYSRRNDNFIARAPQSPRGIVQRLMFGLSTSSITSKHENDSTTSSSGGKSNKEQGKHDGDRDGIHLITEETILKKKSPLAVEVKSGRELPFIYSEKKIKKQVETVVLDSERLIIFDYRGDEEIMEILDF
ncbi:uncharacterized protein L201_007822 [Kwoniella dendrophila CBS 6074]|uniref:F-box domain-containing protein n=1 Tax=Kwoniella dendrophila CBS 6074 TaxID=1295534 RepID=A0AAX4K560_9TREE